MGENSAPRLVSLAARTQLDAGRAAGAFPLVAGSKDAVLNSLLAPGSYSVHVLGARVTNGVVLVEVYELR